MSKNSELRTKGSNSVALPDYLQDTKGLGNENLTREDISIPRIGIIQSLSPERQKADSKYIPGCEEGQFFNTVTREILPESFRFVDIFYSKTFGVFTRREFGGGFRGQFSSAGDAQNFINSQDNPAQLEIIDTGIHVIIRLDDNDAPIETAIVMFNKSKMKVSRQINTIVKGKGTARFATVWEMSTVPEKSAKGPYYNFKVADKGWASKSLFEYAYNAYQEVKDKDLSASAAAANQSESADDVAY